MTTKLFFAICLAALRVSAQGLNDAPLPPSEADQKTIIERIRTKALEFDKLLPDFVCTQLSHHSIDAKSMNQWKTIDTFNEQLRFVNHAEEYALVAQNGKKASGNEKRPASLISVKEFNDVLLGIFDPKVKTEFAWTNWEVIRGHRVHMLSFNMKKENSTFTMGKSKGIVVGLAGFIYADADTYGPIRIVMAATEIPAKYPMQAMSYDMNYDFIRVGDKIHLLPLKAELRWKDGKMQIWDEAELKDFKKP